MREEIQTDGQGPPYEDELAGWHCDGYQAKAGSCEEVHLGTLARSGGDRVGAAVEERHHGDEPRDEEEERGPFAPTDT